MGRVSGHAYAPRPLGSRGTSISNEPDVALLDDVASFFLSVFKVFASDVARSTRAGATPSQLRTLQVVALNPGATVAEVARSLAVTNASACVALTKLAALGWVVQKTDRSDRRLRRIRLTRAGRAVVDEFRNAQMLRVSKVLERFNDKEVRGFRRLIRRMTSAIGETCEQ